LDNIAQIEEDFNLPKGVESRRRDIINASYYWTYEINPGNVDEHIKYAKMGGFRAMSIYYPAFEGFGGYNLIGNYEIDKKLYPNGKEDLKKMLDKIKAAGITPGVHFLHSHIGRKSQYVTPVPDYRLNLLKTFNLSENLGRDDTVLFVEQNPAGCTVADGCRVLRVGTELISYENFTTTRPYQFTGCVRGVNQTTINSLPKGYSIGLLDVSEFGATSVYIDQRTSLQDEIAEKIANIYDAGFQFMYFDGSEGVNPPFGINVPLAQYRVFKRLQPAPLFAEGAAKAHFSWHMLSGGNAFDVFPPETIKEETRKWPADEAPRMRQDFTRLNFGWLGYFLPNEHTIGTQPDMWEFVTSVAAAWDCPVSVHVSLGTFDAHPRTADNLETVRRWEEVRAQHWLTEAQKKMLQNVHQEHHLLINEQNQFELVPYEQMTDIAGGSKEIRAFIFQRQNANYVVYWHISGNKQLELPLKPTDITLYEKLGQEVTISSDAGDKVVVPVGNRRYIKANNLTKEQLSEAFKNAKIVE
jgi:flagellar biosynthesis/type III secretory pathway chaperone